MGRMALIVYLVTISVVSLAQAPTTHFWPEISPVHSTFHFPDAQKADLKETVRGKNGKPLYTWNATRSQVAPSSRVFNFSGDFECVLHPYHSGDGYSTLLTELPYADADWESQGVFWLANSFRHVEATRTWVRYELSVSGGSR